MSYKSIFYSSLQFGVIDFINFNNNIVMSKEVPFDNIYVAFLLMSSVVSDFHSSVIHLFITVKYFLFISTCCPVKSRIREKLVMLL